MVVALAREGFLEYFPDYTPGKTPPKDYFYKACLGAICLPDSGAKLSSYQRSELFLSDRHLIRGAYVERSLL